MRIIDEHYLKRPWLGSRKMTQELKSEYQLHYNRKRIQRLMRLMGLESTLPKPGTSKAAPEHDIYPYLLRNVKIESVNHVWSADITYIPVEGGWVYLVAVMDWYFRFVLSWQLSNTMDTSFCIDALKSALRIGKPLIFNTDQGAQFTSPKFTAPLKQEQVKISMDGKGRCLDNIWIERLWRTVKYEEVYLKEYQKVMEAFKGLESYFGYYNWKRPHQSLDYQTPAQVYYGQQWQLHNPHNFYPISV